MFDPHTAKLCSVFKVPTCVKWRNVLYLTRLFDSCQQVFDIFFFVSPANSFFAATTNISILVIFERSNQPFHSLYHRYSRQSCNILPCRFCFFYSALSFFLILQWIPRSFFALFAGKNNFVFVFFICSFISSFAFLCLSVSLIRRALKIKSPCYLAVGIPFPHFFCPGTVIKSFSFFI